MPTIVNIDEFLALSKKHPILDVRSPEEYEKGSIPNAHNLALFTNAERAIVGTAYKQVSREMAVNKGLEFFGPKMKSLANEAKAIDKGTTFLVHCWRGGMRSATIAWLLELYGLKVYILRGGYKAYRKAVLKSFNEDRKLLILGGRTGAGKTLILKELRELGEQVIDLERIANHKGSSFGALGEKKQPSQEMFENILFMCLNANDCKRATWIEDESSMIGTKVIPKDFFIRMRNSTVIFIDIPFDTRLNYLIEEYGKFDILEIEKAIERIKKKLGGQQAKIALEAIKTGDLKTAFAICLSYYDKTYDYGISKRNPESILTQSFEELNKKEIARLIILKAMGSKI
ncbi:MAG: tRNA 2-selenouridine(34) synthase MnmH [Bacteroidia bacterium]